MSNALTPLHAITPTATAPTCGRVVLVKYTDPKFHGVRELPGTVIRPLGFTPGVHPFINVSVVGDGPVNSPIQEDANPVVLYTVPLFDPLDGAVPEVSVSEAGSPFSGRRVWCEWMPYQKAKHTERGNTTGPTA